MKTDKKHIGELLEKFMAGKTTLDEESLLGEYFRTSKDIPDEWEAYRMMFAWFDSDMKAEPELRPKSIGKQVDMRHQTKHFELKRMVKWLSAACVAVLLIAAAWLKLGTNASRHDNASNPITQNVRKVSPAANKGSKKWRAAAKDVELRVDERAQAKNSSTGNSVDLNEATPTRNQIAVRSLKTSVKRAPSAPSKIVEPQDKETRPVSIDDKTNEGCKDKDGKSHYRFYNDGMMMASAYSYTVTKLQDNEYDTILYAVYYH